MILYMACTRRGFLAALSVSAATAQTSEPIIDIHQHTHYSGRSDEDLIAHQRTMGITKTMLLPSGSVYGLEADAHGNDSVLALARKHPDQFFFFANEVPYLPEARAVLEKYLKLGAIGIGEQKFFVDSNSNVLDPIAELAQAFGVPILLHFQHERYNVNIDGFHRVLSRFPKVNFIGHAQTWWANIDRGQVLQQEILYPPGKVTAGGITDRYLSDYPNMYGDLSAGSGLNALLRDEDHARAFLKRHQDKLLYGSDCSDTAGAGPKCSGSRQIAALRRLAPGAVSGKILYRNAAKLFKLS
ncbi:MAG: amidohydrolase family protein [Acidobacteriia bacterium]|nr:amidohydrolase family protein [Terriglobia bacterium]